MFVVPNSSFNNTYTLLFSFFPKTLNEKYEPVSQMLINERFKPNSKMKLKTLLF